MTSPWVVRPKPNPQAKLRVFCFPYAGGGASVFRRWPLALPPAVEVCALELPGRGVRLREPAFTQLGPLVRSLARGVLPYLDTPFVFFGHSLGGLVGFELARELRRAERMLPLHLIVSAVGAPHVPQPGPRIHDLPDARLVEELRRLNGTPRELLGNAELMQMVLPTLRADLAVYERYAYREEPPLDCPITVFGGLHDRMVSRDRLEAWGDQTSARSIVRMLPGDHFFLHASQTLLLAVLSRELDELVTHPRPGDDPDRRFFG